MHPQQVETPSWSHIQVICGARGRELWMEVHLQCTLHCTASSDRVEVGLRKESYCKMVHWWTVTCGGCRTAAWEMVYSRPRFMQQMVSALIKWNGFWIAKWISRDNETGDGHLNGGIRNPHNLLRGYPYDLLMCVHCTYVHPDGTSDDSNDT